MVESCTPANAASWAAPFGKEWVEGVATNQLTFSLFIWSKDYTALYFLIVSPLQQLKYVECHEGGAGAPPSWHSHTFNIVYKIILRNKSIQQKT